MKPICSLFLLVLFLAMNVACNNNTGNNAQSSAVGKDAKVPDAAPTNAPPTEAVSDGFFKIMQGKVGTAEIEMRLLKVANRLRGSYSYTKIGARLELIAPDNKDNLTPDGSFTLLEFGEDAMGEYGQSGEFSGKILPDGKMSGTWKSADGKRSLPFELTERSAKASANMAIRRIVKTEGNCDTDETCCHFEVVYPDITFISEGNAQIMQTINGRIMQILSESMPSENPTNPQEAATQFCKEFNEVNTETDFKTSWEFEIMPEIYLNDANILSIGFANYVYMGGAHPNSAETMHNFKLTTGKELELTDIFKAGYQPKLTAIAEQKVRQLHNIPPKKPLSEYGFFEDTFELNNNFSLSLKGITFLYNPYEITPYVMGEQRIYIPFTEVKDLLKPDGVVFW